jgi:hypothetical protein
VIWSTEAEKSSFLSGYAIDLERVLVGHQLNRLDRLTLQSSCCGKDLYRADPLKLL